MDTTLVNLLPDAVQNNGFTLTFIIAYVLSEIIGASKLKSNGLLHLILNMVITICKTILDLLKKKEGA